MYDAITEFIKTLSADSPLLWALLVTGVVACTSLLLFAVWEVVLRLVFPARVTNRNSRRPSS